MSQIPLFLSYFVNEGSKPLWERKWIENDESEGIRLSKNNEEDIKAIDQKRKTKQQIPSQVNNEAMSRKRKHDFDISKRGREKNYII